MSPAHTDRLDGEQLQKTEDEKRRLVEEEAERLQQQEKECVHNVWMCQCVVFYSGYTFCSMSPVGGTVGLCVTCYLSHRMVTLCMFYVGVSFTQHILYHIICSEYVC